MRGGERDGQRRCVVGEENVGHAAKPQLGANRDVPQQGEGQRRGRAAAAEHRFERGGGIEDGVDRTGLQCLVGLPAFVDIHPRDLVDETGEVTAGQLPMDDWPDHASLLATSREAKMMPVIYLTVP
jgi:hypothetical protein